MLESLFTNIFGRSKSKNGSDRNMPGPINQMPGPGNPMSGPSNHMTGPFSQMPQPPAPYSPAGGQMPSYYPSLPFSQPPAMPMPYGGPEGNVYGTLVHNHLSPLDQVPFEARIECSLSRMNSSTNLEQLFKEIKQAADVVDRVDTYLRSNQSDYDFKTEQGILYQ